MPQARLKETGSAEINVLLLEISIQADSNAPISRMQSGLGASGVTSYCWAQTEFFVSDKSNIKSETPA